MWLAGLARPAGSPRWRPAIISALVALALYGVTLGGTYVYDDTAIILRDERIIGTAPWRSIWTKQYFPGGVDNLYRPLVTMTYAVQWWMHGNQAWAFHLVNWLLHAAVCAAVAELARRLAGIHVAYLAGLLFAVHPIHVEAVANIVGRAELMCALGMVGGLILYMHRPLTIPRMLGIFGCFVFATLSKEQGLMLPLMLLAWGVLRPAQEATEKGSGSEKGSAPISAQHSSGSFGKWGLSPFRTMAPGERRATLWMAMLMCYGLAGYIVFRESILRFWWDRIFLDWTQNPLVLAQGIHRQLMPVVLVGHYVALLLAPVRLTIDYGGSIIGYVARANDPYLYLGIAAVAGWLGLFVAALVRRWRVVLFCLIAMALSYGLMSNLLVIIGTNFGERLAYLPSIFFLLLVAMGLARIPRPVLVPLMTVVLLLACVRTFTYAQRWNDRLRFYEISLTERPESIRLYMLVADMRMQRGELSEAKRVLEQARGVLPEYADIWIQSGLVAGEMNDFDEAERFYQKAIDLRRHRNIADVVHFRDRLRARRAATRATTQMRR